MKSYQITKYGKDENLQIRDVPLPQIGTDDVLVQIYSASVNPLDAKILSGEFKLLLPYKPPFTLGHDFAGVITEIGKDVTKFKVGDEVYGRPRDFRIGTFAQFISVHQDDIAIKPKNLTMDEAASIPLIGLTAWQALVEKAQLQKGQKVFIQAGSGGVGTFAIQLAKHIGAYVATTTSTKNVELVKSLGADEIIDYTKQDFEKSLKEYDLVLNSLDSITLEKSVRILRRGGLALSISGPPDINFAEEINAGLTLKLATRFLSNKITKLAANYGANYSFLFMKSNGAQLAELSKLIESGAIKPVIAKVFNFDETNEAIRFVATRRASGKVIIQVK